MMEKRLIRLKEDENDLKLVTDLEMLRGIMGIIWLDE
jgi:hypothetical protein